MSEQAAQCIYVHLVGVCIVDIQQGPGQGAACSARRSHTVHSDRSDQGSRSSGMLGLPSSCRHLPGLPSESFGHGVEVAMQLDVSVLGAVLTAGEVQEEAWLVLHCMGASVAAGPCLSHLNPTPLGWPHRKGSRLLWLSHSPRSCHRQTGDAGPGPF